MNFWINMLFIFLISWPFIVLFFAIKKLGATTTVNRLENAKLQILNVERIMNITKHVSTQAKEVIKALQFVEKEIGNLKDTIILNVTTRVKETGSQDLTEDEDRIYEIFKDNRLTKLSADLSDVADRCVEVANIKWHTKEGMEWLNKTFGDKTDRDIVKWFIHEEDLNYCEDLAFVVQYIKNNVKGN